MTDFRVGEKVKVTAGDMVAELTIRHIDPVQKAWERQPESRQFFDLAEIVLRAERVLWVAAITSVKVGDTTWVDGFPILDTPEGCMDLSGLKLTVERC